jgi:alpha-glucosidase
MYYGDEIGMWDVPIPQDEVRDPQGLNMPDKNLSRDPSRTPMQWDNSLNAGFTGGTPWLRLDRKYHRINVESEKNDPYSMLSFYRKLIDLRQGEECLSVGDYVPLYSDKQMIAFFRKIKDETCFLIVLNLSHRPCYFKTSKIQITGTVELATSPELEGSEVNEEINLGGDEAIIVRLQKK